MGETLTEFLLARIAEDEKDAYDADPQWPSSRVLAECAAKQWIVEFRQEMWKHEPGERQIGDGILTHLAMIYADHPDYQQDWAV
jgi:hypothetical protein